MSEKRVVLVTGVAGYWGGRLAQQLLADPSVRVIGLDRKAPADFSERLDFIQADFSDPLMPELLAVEKVDSVCHLAFWETPRHNEASFDYNVMGAMKLFGACAAAGVGQIVYKSSTQVYGAHPDNPAYLSEADPLRASKQLGYNRHRLEMEAFCNGFSRQYEKTSVTVLRFANIVGPTADTPFTRYLDWRATPTLLGFNPMLQVIHEDDVISALAHATQSESAGAFNIAADPAMPLKRVLALAKVMPLPLLHLLAYSRRINPYRRRMSLEADYLRYRWTVDTARMADTLDFTPYYTGDEAIQSLKLRKGKTRKEKQPKADQALPLHMVIEARRNKESQVATPAKM